jgi:hypothetical protein
MSQQRNMVIHFMDGTKLAYDFPKQVAAGLSVISKIEKVLEKQYLVIESEGVMQLYPVNNIKSIQFHPLPERLPDFVIRDAQSVDVY